MQNLGAITVREAVSLVQGARVVAGAEGLERVVRSVGVIEAPDAHRFAKVGDLLVTALYAIRDDPEAQIRLVPEVNRRGAAALAVKRSYVGSLPGEMLARADEVALPLVELPPEIAFSDVLQPIFAKIVSRQATVLARQQEVHRALMKAVLEGRGLESLALTLAGLLRSPVAIRDTGRQVLAWVPLDLPPEEEALLAELNGKDAQQTEYLLSAGESLHRHEVLRARGRRLSRIVTPVVVGSQTHGELLVWETGPAIGELELIALGSAATVIALEFANRRAVQEVERRYRSEFLVALFAGGGHQEAALAQRARLLGLDLAAPHYVLALKADSVGATSAQDAGNVRAALDQAFDAVNRMVGGRGLAGEVDLHVVALVRAPEGEGARREVSGQVGRLWSQLEPLSRLLRMTLGVGSIQAGVEGVRRSFREARRAAAIAERVWGPGRVAHVEDLGVYHILDMVGPSEEMERFLEGIRRLAEYDRLHHTDLVRTLEVFFARKGNVRKVSESLYTHYNTVLYRLQRIEQITGMSLEDPDHRLYLQLGLQAARLAGIVPPAPVGAAP